MHGGAAGKSALALLTTALVTATPAVAAEVAIETNAVGRGYYVTVAVTAAPEEENDIVVSGTLADLVVEDRGALLTQAGCEQLSPHRVRCRPPRGTNNYLEVDVGDGHDRVATEPRAEIRLGSGDDAGQLLGGGSIDGGGGRDALAGGPGEDVLDDGDDPARPDADTIDGRSGLDVVSYADRRRPVRVDLDREGPVAGEAREGDSVTSVESVIGGSGADHLTAHRAGSALLGRQGRDRLVGRGGDDLVVGGSGRDSLSGGAGDDRLQPNGDDSGSLNLPSDRDVGSGYAPDDGVVDRIWCGAGLDRVQELTGDFMANDCERFHFFDEIEVGRVRPFRPTVGAAIVSFPVGCDRGCAWALEARVASGPSRGDLLAGRAGAVTQRRGVPRRIALRLSPGGRLAFRGGRCVLARVTVRSARFFDRPRFGYLTRLCAR